MTNDTMKLQIGRRLLRWAFRLLPEWSDERKAIDQALKLRREYERYVNLSSLLDCAVLPFSQWCEEYKRVQHWRRFMGHGRDVPQRSRTTARDRVLMGEAVAL